jgi:hypothetical protein
MYAGRKMTDEERSTESAPDETAVVKEAGETLSLRDALEVALEAQKDDAGNDEGVGAPSARAATDAEPGTNTGGDAGNVSASDEPPLQPPAEFNADEKADFLLLSRKQQEAQIRLHKSRLSRLEEIKAASRDYEHVRRLAQQIEPYIKARGIKEPADVAIQKAVALWAETKADPKRSAAALLKANGLPVPRDLLESETRDPDQEKLSPLQERLIALESRIVREDQEKAASALNSIWSSFEQQRNAAGSARFPDIQPDKGQSGLQLASEIGSLVSGKTPLSLQFINSVRARNPHASAETLITEAYRFLGGKVDDSEAARTQSPQQHLYKSNRAAASVPGRGVSSSSSSVKKFKSYREALEAAKAELEG